MCDWRQRHSEDKKWYLNVKNFSKEFSKDNAMVEALNAYFQNTESFVETSPPMNVEMLNSESDGCMHAYETVRATKQGFNTYNARAELRKIYRMLDWHDASSSFKQDTGRPCA